MTESATDALAPDETDQALAEAKRKSAMEDAIADQRYYLERVGQALAAMKTRLEEAGFIRRTTDDQFTSERTGMKVDMAYAGGEFGVRVVSADLIDGRTMNCRITQDLWARQPQCVDALTQILILVDQGAPHEVWLDAGGTLLGLEAGADWRNAESAILFGERPAAVEAEREEEAAEVHRDAERPDMSGSTRSDDR